MSHHAIILACMPADPLMCERLGALTGMECTPYAGSIEDRCASCRCKIWVGPRQLRFAEARRLCLICALPEAAMGTPVNLAEDFP